MLIEQIKGYLISHAHLDHVAGLVIASPDDAKKPIYGLPSVLEDIQGTYFNWEAWPNFGSGGKEPQLKKYDMTPLTPGERRDLQGTAMQVTAYPLSHGGVESTAFLIESGEDALLCFGDTGPDEVEKSTNMQDIWVAVAERVKQKQLKAIIIETSYYQRAAGQAALRPSDAGLAAEIAGRLGNAGRGRFTEGTAGGHQPHQIFAEEGRAAQQAILAELEAGNTLGVRYIIPEQGTAWRF